MKKKENKETPNETPTDLNDVSVNSEEQNTTKEMSASLKDARKRLGKLQESAKVLRDKLKNT